MKKNIKNKKLTGWGRKMGCKLRKRILKISEIRHLRFSFNHHMMSTVPKTESAEDFLPIFNPRDEDGALAIMVAFRWDPLII